jgi:hypothetical protein
MDIDQIKKSVVMSDAHILLRKPISIEKYGKEVQIRPVNWFYEWPDFSYALGVFLHYYYVICSNSKLPDSLNDLKEFRDNIKTTITHKQAWKMMCKVCRYSGFKIRWMKKKFNIDDWIEIFITVFFCNVTLIQKGLFEGLKAIGKVPSRSTK